MSLSSTFKRDVDKSEKLKSSQSVFSSSMSGSYNFDTNYIIAQKTKPAVDALETFLNETNYTTPKKCIYTNIQDDAYGRTFCVPFNVKGSGLQKVDIDAEYYSGYGKDAGFLSVANQFTESQDENCNTPIDEIFKYLEECRINGIILSFAEKQYFTIPSEKSRRIIEMPDDAIGNIDEPDPSIDYTMDQFDQSNDSADDDLDNIQSDPISDETALQFINQVNEETQISNDIEVDKSCIEFDFDIYLKKEQELENNMFIAILQSFTTAASKSIDWVGCDNPDVIVENRSGKTNVKFYAAVLRKPQRRISDSSEAAYNKYGDCWKESFHIRIYLKVSKAFKLYFRKKMLEDESFQAHMADLDMINDLEDAFDRSAISNPAMILGSAKPGGKRAHELHQLFEITYRFITGSTPVITEQNIFHHTESDAIKKYKEFKKKGKIDKMHLISYNLAYELSLNYESHRGFIKKREFDPIPSIKAEIESYKERAEDNLISDKELERYEQNVGQITVRDFKAKYVKHVLDIIAHKRVRGYESWKQVVLMLARENQDYKPLAIWFSIRYAKSFLQGDALSQIDGLFNHVLKHKINDRNEENMTILTLYHWARMDNPEAFQQAQETNMFMKLRKYCFEFAGDLNDTQVASILREMFGHKFKCDENRLFTNKKSNRIWREFVFPEDDSEIGQLYKWREESRPDTLEQYVSKKMPDFLQSIINFCAQQKERASKIKDKDQKEKEMKYFESVRKGVKLTQKNLGNHSKINSIIQRCGVEFRVGNRGFENNMDQDPDYVGVANGVLKLRPKTELIQRYHEIPISKSTKVDFVPYDSNDKYIHDLENIVFRPIFANDEETYRFWMMFIASGLDANTKSPQMFAIWHGEGAQGKTTIAEFDTNTFGVTNKNGYVCKMNPMWFCTPSKSNGPDSALADTKNARKIWTSELEEETEIYMSKIKQMGETLSGNEKNQTQDTWHVPAHTVLTTNNEPVIKGRDYGTWRRLLYYRFKMIFLAKHEMDPKNPFHAEARGEIMERWVKDRNYQQAYLSILVHYYEILRDEYGFNLKKVPKTAIDKETMEFHKRQDTLTQFICERIHHIGDYYEDGEAVEPVSLMEIVQKYTTWMRRNHGEKITVNRQDTRMYLSKHKLLSKQIEIFNNQTYLTRHKVLEINDTYKDIEKSSNASSVKEKFNNTDEIIGEDSDNIPDEFEESESAHEPDELESNEPESDDESDDEWLNENVEI